MKNIHVLPTDKSSRLIIYSTLLNEFRLLDEPIEDWKHKRHIYITSDEEIKEGDWFLKANTNQPTKRIHLGNNIYKEDKKIILTTDQDLIKDGVQAIDEEFLEWYVKNPSCEYVKVYYRCDKSGCYLKEWNNCCKEAKPVLTLFAENESKAKYFREQEIIIPKKEPKKIFNLPIATNLGSALTETMKSVSQHEGGIKHGEINLPNFKEEVCTCTTDECLGYLTKKCKRIVEPKQEILVEEFNEQIEQLRERGITITYINKQETLEEAAENYGWRIKRNTFSDAVKANELAESAKQDFIAGANWMKERMYSEEDLKYAFDSGRVRLTFDKERPLVFKNYEEWFEQFKKK